MKPKLFDTIRLLTEAGNGDAGIGDLGVIVAVFSEPDEAYEIEVCDEDGATKAQFVLEASQFEVISRSV